MKPAFAKLRIAGVGWHTFRHSVGSILAGMGNTSSRSATTCVPATSTSPTNPCKRLRRPSVSHKGNWSTRFCPPDRCLRASRLWFSKSCKTIYCPAQHRVCERLFCWRRRALSGVKHSFRSGILIVVARRTDSPKLLLRGGQLPHSKCYRREPTPEGENEETDQIDHATRTNSSY